ncbi:MAG: hypothetical protein C5B54_00545 [Acidobacteria bacterium]|nr:MAG: hypothetical protein C5B54_00545 [Acidobacteriota bacterium]
MTKYFFLCVLLISCMHAFVPNLEKEKQEILKVEESLRAFHLSKDAKSFTDLFSDNFLAINNGIVDSPSRQTSFEKFDQYFKNSEFIKWDDSKKPVIRFSTDGSLAYVAVQKEVVVKTSASSKADSTNFAWLTVYKKDETGWKIDCVVSTNK